MSQENSTGNGTTESTDSLNSQSESSNSHVEALKLEVQQLKESVEKYKNEYLYLRAEFENYKKNAIKERSDISKYGSERLINEILAVTDNFDRALSFELTAENAKTYVQGVQMTAAELKATLQKFGVSEVKSEGMPFDPSIHEALSSEVSTEVSPGHVLRVFKKAYKLHDRVIRPAQVVVAQGE